AIGWVDFILADFFFTLAFFVPVFDVLFFFAAADFVFVFGFGVEVSVRAAARALGADFRFTAGWRAMTALGRASSVMPFITSAARRRAFRHEVSALLSPTRAGAKAPNSTR